jgi:hypothetical protein
MAEEVAIRGGAGTAKIRSPLGVIGLGIITLGIYSIFWYYFINREMADLGSSYNTDELGDSPGTSVLAITLGALIIVPPFVSFFKTLKRIEASQERTLGGENIPVVLLFILLFLPLVGLFTIYAMQEGLNKVWAGQQG